jgi:hypothetical protein
MWPCVAAFVVAAPYGITEQRSCVFNFDANCSQVAIQSDNDARQLLNRALAHAQRQMKFFQLFWGPDVDWIVPTTRRCKF